MMMLGDDFCRVFALPYHCILFHQIDVDADSHLPLFSIH